MAPDKLASNSSTGGTGWFGLALRDDVALAVWWFCSLRAMAEPTPPREQLATAGRVWLEEHWTESRACPICANNNWLVDAPYQVDQHAGSHREFGGVPYRILPVFPVMCTVCGYTFFVNALIAGIVPRDPQPGLPEADESDA